jgi:hypothetical protein
MVFIVMFIHKLPRNHFSTVLALLEVTGAMYRMQVNVRRRDLPLTVRAGGDGGGSRGEISVGAGRCHVARPLTSGSRSDRRRGRSPHPRQRPSRAGLRTTRKGEAGGPERWRGEERRPGGEVE